MWVGHARYDGAHLAFIWDINAACPGHFLELFHPISTVIFATNISRYVLDKHAKVVYENSASVFSWILRMNNIPRYGRPPWGEIESMMYARYTPLPHVLHKVEKYVIKHNICYCSAMHIRRTDLQKDLERSKKHPPSLHPFIRFTDSRPNSEPVFLITDCPETQAMFINKYGSEKILVYQTIPNSITFSNISNRYMTTSTSASTSDTVTDMTKKKKGMDLPLDYRFTSLEHALIDIMIAGYSRDFKGSPYSSLSELVTRFAHNGNGRWGRSWCDNYKSLKR